MTDLERLSDALDDGIVVRGPAGEVDNYLVIEAAAIAYRDLLADGQRVEWCETHDCQGTTGGRWCICVGPSLDGETIDDRAEQAKKYDCRIVSKLLTDHPTTEKGQV